MGPGNFSFMIPGEIVSHPNFNSYFRAKVKFSFFVDDVINRPGEAGAVLQIASSLIN